MFNELVRQATSSLHSRYDAIFKVNEAKESMWASWSFLNVEAVVQNLNGVTVY